MINKLCFDLRLVRWCSQTTFALLWSSKYLQLMKFYWVETLPLSELIVAIMIYEVLLSLSNHHQPTCNDLHLLGSRVSSRSFNHLWELFHVVKVIVFMASLQFHCSPTSSCHALPLANLNAMTLTININLIHKHFYARMQFIIFNKANTNNSKESERSGINCEMFWSRSLMMEMWWVALPFNLSWEIFILQSASFALCLQRNLKRLIVELLFMLLGLSLCDGSVFISFLFHLPSLKKWIKVLSTLWFIIYVMTWNDSSWFLFSRFIVFSSVSDPSNLI